jgi:hypothetical protein
MMLTLNRGNLLSLVECVMPPRRRSQQVERCEIVIKADRTVGRFFVNTYYDMCIELEREVTCAIRYVWSLGSIAEGVRLC